LSRPNSWAFRRHGSNANSAKTIEPRFLVFLLRSSTFFEIFQKCDFLGDWADASRKAHRQWSVSAFFKSLTRKRTTMQGKQASNLSTESLEFHYEIFHKETLWILIQNVVILTASNTLHENFSQTTEFHYETVNAHCREICGRGNSCFHFEIRFFHREKCWPFWVRHTPWEQDIASCRVVLLTLLN
jgi:hypothetical protein